MRAFREESLPEPTPQLNIALVVHDLHNRGGHAAYTRILADDLSQRHQVAVFANYCERPATAAWSSHHVRASRASALTCVQTFPLGMRQQAARLAEFDIRHTQGYCGGNPNVVTAHICVAAYLNSLREASSKDRLSLKLMAAAEKKFYRRYRGQVIAISRKVARELCELYEVQLPTTVIPHGVEHQRFKSDSQSRAGKNMRGELGLHQDATVALYVGDLTKAHAYLKALSYAATAVEFVIITGSSQYHWQAPNVRILPPTSNLAPYYAMADAFVFPTTYDAFGMVVLEAMASGLAVFSSDRAGAAELIKSGEDGFVLPLSEWVETTAAILKDCDTLSMVGRAAEKTASLHPWSSVVSRVEQVYFRAASPDALTG